MTVHSAQRPARVHAQARRSADPAELSAWHYLGRGLSAGLLLLVIALAALVIVVPQLTGAIPLTVLTSSMEPGLPPGTLIVVRPVPSDSLAIGDVVTYQIRSGEPAVVTHRIVGISLAADGDRTFTLRGDNNSAPDADPVVAAQMRGRLWYSVPLLGLVNTVLTGPVKAWVVPLAAVGLFGYAGVMVVGGIVEARAQRRGRPAGSDRAVQRP